jgi:hypothetical protein
LESRFPNITLPDATSSNAIGVFKSAHNEVGDLSIFDDGDEATIFIGDITHLHFDSEASSESEIEESVTAEVLAFLEELFADRIVIWKSRRTGADGAIPQANFEISSYVNAEDLTYVWSGPIENPKRKLAG